MIEISQTMAPIQMQGLLQGLGWLENERVSGISIPGEGNMNVVLRVQTDRRSVILKQSRPYVRKYRDVAAPIERIEVEYAFYQHLPPSARRQMPSVLGYASEHFLMMMEDLGEIQDLTSLYPVRQVDPAIVSSLLAVLRRIHATGEVPDFPDNLALRELNHAHIFDLPFKPNHGFDLGHLQRGLESLAVPWRAHSETLDVIERLGRTYLSAGSTLIHGDYYPGSWMSKEGAIYVIDPEFGFVGPPEFDLGVMAAHLTIINGTVDHIAELLSQYGRSIRSSMVYQFAGVEIARRLIGLAQLPLSRTIDEKEELLNLARRLLLLK